MRSINLKYCLRTQIEVYEDKGSNPDKIHSKLKPTSINNRGASMCFDEPDPERVPFYLGQPTRLTLTKCPGYGGSWPTRIQFYREVYLLGNAFSELVKTVNSPTAASTVDISVDDLPKGLQIVVKAKSTLGSDVTTATVKGTITEPNYAPTSITLSNTKVEENVPLDTM